MDRSSTAILIKSTYTIGDIGQRVETKSYRTIFCQIRSVTGTEWFAGGQNGIKPSYQLTMFKYDYENELLVNIGGTIVNGVLTGGRNYSVYRTYEAKNDSIELYLEEKAGTK